MRLFECFVCTGHFFAFFAHTFALRLFLIEIAFDGVQNAVDELGSFEGRKAAGDFERFVDGHGARSGFVKKFVNGEPEDVAIDEWPCDRCASVQRANGCVRPLLQRARACPPPGAWRTRAPASSISSSDNSDQKVRANSSGRVSATSAAKSICKAHSRALRREPINFQKTNLVL